MSKIKKYLCYMITATLLCGCIPSNVPRAYVPGISKVYQNSYGCWMITELKPTYQSVSTDDVSGELLAIQNDSILLLVDDYELVVFQREQVDRARLITHKNQAGTLGLMTGGFFLPNIIGTLAYGYTGFLVLGIPVLITGVTLTIVEASDQANILDYPEENELLEFIKFARYPQGIPPDIDTKQLTLNH
jgi:hypothetical protein